MKKYSIEISKSHIIYNLMKEPIRNKKQADILLLETMKTFIIGNIEGIQNSGKIILQVNKMNRFIYKIENKIFSISCPFTCLEKDNAYIFKDAITNIEINSKLISYLISIIKRQDNYEIEELIEEVVNVEEYEEMQETWEVLKRLYSIEYGYLRFDYDEEQENGKLHPLNHLDINFVNSSQFKIGLNKKITLEEFTDIIDLTTDCYYLDK